jgi:adenosylcobyric acid synthase
LFDDGVRLLEEYTGIPVLGVIPHIPDLGIEEEDSVALDEERYRLRKTSDEQPDRVHIAVVQLPHISNFTDFDPLFLDPGVHAYFCRKPDDIGHAHAMIVPGSKNTIDDMRWLRQSGFVEEITQKHRQGTVVFGVCGGYQMLGQEVRDPSGQESNAPLCSGLNLLPVVTTLQSEKTTVLVQGQLEGIFASIPVSGYEIHMGQSVGDPGYQPFSTVRTVPDGELRPDGAMNSDGTVMGTYLHGIFDNDVFRQQWLNQIRDRVGLPAPITSDWSMLAARSESFDRLASIVRQHMNMDVLYEILGLIPKRAEGALC